MNAYTDEEIAVIRIEARTEERAKIVAWLERGGPCLEVDASIISAAEAIDRGDHLK